MNKIDMARYKHLKAFSQIPLGLYEKYKTKHTNKKGKYMEGEIWDGLCGLGYINKSPDSKELVTEKGMEQLRMLEDIRRKNLTLIVSIIAIVLSLFAFAKSMGWM